LWGLVLAAVKGPKRKLKDPDFHREINKIVSSYSLTKEDFFVDALRKNLSFPANIRTSFEIVSKETMIGEQWRPPKQADVHLIINLNDNDECRKR